MAWAEGYRKEDFLGGITCAVLSEFLQAPGAPLAEKGN